MPRKEQSPLAMKSRRQNRVYLTGVIGVIVLLGIGLRMHRPEAGTGVPSTRPTSNQVSAASQPSSPTATTSAASPQHSPEKPPTPECEAALRQGLAALQRADIAASTRAFERAARADPYSGLAHDYLGIAYLKQKQYASALKEFQEETRLEPDDSTGWTRIADVEVARGNPQNAIQALEKAAALRPTEAQLQFNLGMLYPRVMELGKAVEALTRCVTIEPENHYAHYLRGELLYKLARLDEAEQALQEAIRLEPRAGSYHVGLAQVYLRREATGVNTERARVELEHALELGAPEPAAVHYNLGQCFQRQGKPDAALRELQLSVHLAPRAWAAYYALQEVLRQLGRPEEAQRALERFRTLRAAEDARMRLAFYTQEVERNPDSPVARYQLAEFLARSGDRTRARQVLAHAQQMTASKQGDPELQRHISELATELGHNQK